MIHCEHCGTSQRDMLAIRAGERVDLGAAGVAEPCPEAICCEEAGQ
jgi:hypothetical protein